MVDLYFMQGVVQTYISQLVICSKGSHSTIQHHPWMLCQTQRQRQHAFQQARPFPMMHPSILCLRLPLRWLSLANRAEGKRRDVFKAWIRIGIHVRRLYFEGARSSRLEFEFWIWTHHDEIQQHHCPFLTMMQSTLLFLLLLPLSALSRNITGKIVSCR